MTQAAKWLAVLGCVVVSAYLAIYGQGSAWGWFLFVAVLIGSFSA